MPTDGEREYFRNIGADGMRHATHKPWSDLYCGAYLMELGAIVCTARSPKCAVCPFEADCAWRQSGAPAPAGPSRRPQRYAGTDRQVRGLILEVLRHATGPVPRQRLDLVWSDDVQRARALAGLVTDGLIEPHGEQFALAGDVPATEIQQL